MKGDKSFLIFLIFLVLVYGKRVQNPCESGKVPCDNGECIDRWDWCGWDVECTDRSDEKYCNTNRWFSSEVKHTCTEKHFSCEDGMCIPASLRCDFHFDCNDRSDEKNCETLDQEESQYTSEKEPEYFYIDSTSAEKRDSGTTTIPTSPAQTREISTTALPTFTEFFNSLRTTNTPASRTESTTTALPTSTDFYDSLKTYGLPEQRKEIFTTALPTSTDFYNSRRTTSTTAQRKEISTTALPPSTSANDNWRTEETRNTIMRYYYLLPLFYTYDPRATPPIINTNYSPFDSRYIEQNKNRRDYISHGENFPSSWQPRVPETTTHKRPYISSLTTTSRHNSLRPGYPYVGRRRLEVFTPRSYPSTSLTISLRHNIRTPEYSPLYFINSYTPYFELQYRTDTQNTKDWFLSQKEVSYGWDRGIPRGLNALLPFSNSFQSDVEYDELMRKNLPTHLGGKIGVNEFFPNDDDELVLWYQREI